MKKLLNLIVLGLALAFSLSACSDDDEPVKTKQLPEMNNVAFYFSQDYVTGEGKIYDFNGLAGGGSNIVGIMINEDGLTEFERILPGTGDLNKHDMYGRVTTKDYYYNPLTGELSYELTPYYLESSKSSRRTYMLEIADDGVMFAKTDAGILPLGFPECLESSETELVPDPNSYTRIIFNPLSESELAEYLEKYRQH